jgi:hypothetical protein
MLNSFQRAAVEVLNRNRFQIDIFQTANVDSRHTVALRINTFAKRMDAACIAKSMLDHMLVERVGTERLLRRQKL